MLIANCIDKNIIFDFLTIVSGVMYVCVHGARNVIASDRGGTSDPYCVLFCDRRRVILVIHQHTNLNSSTNVITPSYFTCLNTLFSINCLQKHMFILKCPVVTTSICIASYFNENNLYRL